MAAAFLVIASSALMRPLQPRAGLIIAMEPAYGRDPRLAPAWITENEELLAQMAQMSAAAPKASAASKSAAIASLVTLDDLEDALARAKEANLMLVIKYFSPSCRSCLAMKPHFEHVAETSSGELAAFYVRQSRVSIHRPLRCSCLGLCDSATAADH